ncbi:MAG: hypothetical protein KBT68_11710 [bacterium]|nr:hypothetical protein [Candidatus Colisoma equi]
MKTLIAFLTLSLAACALAEADKKIPFEKMTPEQKAEFRRQRNEARYRKTGGKVFDRRDQKGNVVFLNAQKVVDEREISSIPSKLGEILRRSIVLRKGDAAVTYESLPTFAAKLTDEATIILTDDAKLPSLLVAPEAGYALVNVAAFKTDDAKAMVRRTRREMLRAFAFLCAADGTSAGSVLDPVKTPEDIDELVGEGFCQDTIITLDRHLDAIGVKPYSITSYRKACEQGWAANPTNDVQKKIWDEVHAVPSKPMTIKYDPAQKKGIVE